MNFAWRRLLWAFKSTTLQHSATFGGVDGGSSAASGHCLCQKLPDSNDDVFNVITRLLRTLLSRVFCPIEKNVTRSIVFGGATNETRDFGGCFVIGRIRSTWDGRHFLSFFFCRRFPPFLGGGHFIQRQIRRNKWDARAFLSRLLAGAHALPPL